MKFFGTFLYAIVALCSFTSALPQDGPIEINRRSCGARHFKLNSRHGQKDAHHETTVRRVLLEHENTKTWFNLSLPIMIDVYWHAVGSPTRSNMGMVSKEQVEANIAVLNYDYAKTKTFQFRLKEFRQVRSLKWNNLDIENDDQIADLKSQRLGGKAALNIYSTLLNDGLLGFATFPQDINEEFMLDGVVVSPDTLPGGRFGRFSLGRTLTHEVGHWLGLWHTFQDGCSFPNDFVADTRPQDGPSFGCPSDRITCRADDFEDNERRTYYEINRLLGPDPVKNFMDYADDPCLSEFTQGQIDRMRAQWYWRLE